MVPGVILQTVGTNLFHKSCNMYDSRSGFENACAKCINKEFAATVGFLKNGGDSFSWHRLCAIHGRACQKLVVRSISSLFQSTSCNSEDESFSDESALTLLRHGESMWNVKNLFTGCIDVPLTASGIEEAIEAGRRIRNIPIDMIFTSALVRSQMTAMLAMTQHHCSKVPIIVHNESEEAKKMSAIYSEATQKQSVPVITAWQLNERMYGELQGFNKQDTAEKYGKEQVHKWRRSYDTSPPNGESLEVCSRRAVAYFKAQIIPQLSSGKHVLVTAHANSLRSIIMYLDNLTSQEVINLELSTGVPMLYLYQDGKFLRRGSPLGPMHADVYAYSRSLALYRQNLDGMLQ